MAGLIRWNPFDDLTSLWPRELFGRLEPGGGVSVQWSPRCDVDESDEEIVVRAELPGVTPEDMEVMVRDNVLTIRGEKRTERTDESKGKAYTERFFGSFERSITMPGTVNADSIEAALKDGVLEVRLPKVKPAEPEVKRVTIKSS